MKNKAKWLVAVCLLMANLLVAACDPVTFGSAEGFTLMGSDKSLVDHVISYSSGKDCSMLRREQDLTYCVEDMPQIRQNIYCYRDLGGVTCYDRNDPHGANQNQQRVDRNDHNLPK